VASLLGALSRPRNDAPAPLVSRSRGGRLGGFFQRRDVATQLSVMELSGTIFGIVDKTSTAVAKTEWHLYRKAKSGKDEDRVEVTSHAALDIINKPNQHTTRMELFEAAQQHLDLAGESCLLVGRNTRFRGLPLELWPVRPDRLEPVPDPDKFLVGWVYTSPDGEQVPLRLDEVIQTKMPDPNDPYRGLGPVGAVLTDIMSARYATEWNANFFKNSAEPGGIIEIDRRLSDDEFDELSTRWEEQHRGVARAHRVAILEQGHWVDRKITQRDMEFSALRGATRDAIMEAFGFPKSMLGITEDVNRAVAEAGKAIFAEWLTVPRLDRWRDTLNSKYLPLFGATNDLEFDYDSPVPADADAENAERTSRAEAVASLVAVGFDGNSAAEAYELPAGLQWQKPAAPAPAHPIVPGDAGPTPADPGTPPPDTPLAPENAVAALLGTLVRGSAPVVLNAAGWPTKDLDAVEAVNLGPVQAAWESALAALLETWQSSVVVDWIRQLIDGIRAVLRGDGGSLADLRVDTTAAAGHLSSAMHQLAQTAAQHAVAEAAKQDVTLQPAWPSAADLEAAARDAAAFEGRRYALAAGREAARVSGPKPDADAVIGHVEQFLSDVSDASAKYTLAGALTDAQNQGRFDTLTSGPVGALYANEILDSATCKPCREIHGRFVATTDDLAPLYKLYPFGGYVDCLGRERCRGTVVGVWRPKTTEGG